MTSFSSRELALHTVRLALDKGGEDVRLLQLPKALKRIGYYDERLDNFHAEVYLKAVRGPLASRGYEIAGAAALLDGPSRDWAAERGVPYFDSVESLCGAVDRLMILAPSNPEVHLEMCRRAFPLRLPTFVDKTFAPDEATAREIFELADRWGVAIQSTSALRSTRVQQYVAELDGTLRHMTVFASGSSFAEYGIHPVELAVSCFGWQAERLLRLGRDDHPQFLIAFSAGRTAMIDFNLHAEVPFSAAVASDHGLEYMTVDDGRLFIDAAASILDFFDAGRPLIDRRETLVVRRILDAALDEASREEFAHLDAIDDFVGVKP